MNTRKNPDKSFTSHRQIGLDISGGLSQEDLRLLQKTDPFMYYSIPGARRAAIFGRTLGSYDMDELRSNYRSSNGRSESTSDFKTPNNVAQVQPIQKRRRTTAVSFEEDERSESAPDLKPLHNVMPMQSTLNIPRRSLISFEAHPDALLEDSFDAHYDAPAEEFCTRNVPLFIEVPEAKTASHYHSRSLSAEFLVEGFA